MTVAIVCPICMENIEHDQGFMKTDCGHSFHSCCIMRNIAQNGFSCPCCRTVMMETSNGNENYDIEYNRGYEDGQHYEYQTTRVVSPATDIIYEQEQEQEDNSIETPTPAYVADRLIDQGVSYQDLVNIMLLQHNEYDVGDFVMNCERLDDDIFGKIRIIVSNYETNMNTDISPPICPEIGEPNRLILN